MRVARARGPAGIDKIVVDYLLNVVYYVLLEVEDGRELSQSASIRHDDLVVIATEGRPNILQKQLDDPLFLGNIVGTGGDRRRSVAPPTWRVGGAGCASRC